MRKSQTANSEGLEEAHKASWDDATSQRRLSQAFKHFTEETRTKDELATDMEQTQALDTQVQSTFQGGFAAITRCEGHACTHACLHGPPWA
jgi:hypothetical protein